VFALTRLSEDAERTVNAADVIRAQWTDSEAEVAYLRARLQRSELTLSALLESLQKFQNTSYEIKKRPRHE
jgi:predicted nuclease with TOPRIM domain